MSATIQCSEGTGSQQPMLLHPSKKPKKRVTMIKHMVGKVRTTSHSLPEGSFVFGVANKYDEEGAGKGKQVRINNVKIRIQLQIFDFLFLMFSNQTTKIFCCN